MVKKDVNIEGSSSKRLTKGELEKLLLENFVNLQRVLTNLSEKFDAMSQNINSLLRLFELSAKSLAEKQGREENSSSDIELLNKLEILLDQNKTIAKGLTLIEGRMRENTYGTESSQNSFEEKEKNFGYPGIPLN